MSQKYFELDKEEKELLESFEKGEWKSVPDLAEVKKLLKKYAGNTLEKTKNINLRLSQRTIMKLKAKAIAEGMPYQTLASSVLHKFVNA
jgi:predicted DNA binding CopG/RHH family protein